MAAQIKDLDAPLTDKRNFAAIKEEKESEEESAMNFPESQSSYGNEKMSKKSSQRCIVKSNSNSQVVTFGAQDGSQSRRIDSTGDIALVGANELAKSNSMVFDEVQQNMASGSSRPVHDQSMP